MSYPRLLAAPIATILACGPTTVGSARTDDAGSGAGNPDTSPAVKVPAVKVPVKGHVRGQGKATVLLDPLDLRHFALAYPGENPPLLATTTDDSGHWTIPDVPDGPYRVSATRVGHQADSALIEVTADGPEFALTLDPRPAPFQLRGELRQPDGSAVSDAWLVYRPHGTHGVARAFRANPDGEFELGASRTWAGNAEFTVHAPGFERSVGPTEWLSSREQPNLEAERGQLVRGQVKAPDGEPLAGAVVEGEGLVSATGDDGTFVLGPIGTFHDTIVLARSPNAVGVIRIDAEQYRGGDEVTVEVSTVPAIAVQGRAVTEAAGPLPHALVRLVDVRTGLASEVRTNADGMFEAWGVMPGPHRASWPSVGWAPQFGPVVEVGKGIELEIRRPAALKTETLEVQLDPPTRATVEVALRDERAWGSNSMAVGATLMKTGPDGTAFAEVLPETYEVTVVADDGRGARKTVTVGTDTARIVIPLQTRSSIVGRVVDEQKRPLAEATVVVVWDTEEFDNSAPWTTARCDSEGRFEVPGLEGGSYELTVQSHGATLPFVGASGDDTAPAREVKVAKGTNRPLTLNVNTKTHVLTARVLDPGGKPVEGAKVSVDAFAVGRTATVASNEHGEAKFNVLPVRYQVHADSDGRSAHTHLEPDTQHVELQLEGEPTTGSGHFGRPLWPHRVKLLLDGKPYTGLVVVKAEDGRNNYEILKDEGSVVLGMQWHNVFVTLEGAVYASLNPSNGETTTLELNRWATAAFTAVDAAGHPLANVELEVVNGAAGFDLIQTAYAVTTDDAGRARAPYLVPGAKEVEIRIAGKDYGHRIEPGTLKAGKTVELGTIELDGG